MHFCTYCTVESKGDLIHSAAKKKKLFRKKNIFFLCGDTATGLLSIHHSKKTDVYCSVLILFCFCSTCHLLFYIVPFFVYFFRRRHLIHGFCVFFGNFFCEKMKSLISVFLRFRFCFFSFLKNFFVTGDK